MTHIPFDTGEFASAAGTAVRALKRECFSLMTLLVHLRILAVGRLRVTAAVTTRTVVGIAVGVILSHSLRKPWALRAVLRARRVARDRRLISNRGQLIVTCCLPRNPDSLSHLTVDWRLRSVVVRGSRVAGSLPLVISFAGGFLLLLFGLPLLADLFELCEVVELVSYNTHIKISAKASQSKGRQWLASVI